jgi:hypothetical protein
MAEVPLPLQFLAAWIGTWVARHQERSIAYLKEENRVLLKKLGGRVRLEGPERRRLAGSVRNSAGKPCTKSPGSRRPTRS